MCKGNHSTHTCPCCAVEIIPSHMALYQTSLMFIDKTPKEILIHWFSITQFLVFDLILVIDPFTIYVNFVLILWFSYWSFPRPGSLAAPGALLSSVSSVSSGYSQSVDIKLSEYWNLLFVDWGSSSLTQGNSNAQ